MRAIDAETAQWLRGNGIPVLESASSGLAALGHLARWPLPIDGTRATVQPERRDRWRARAADGISAVELLTDYGVPVLMSRTARSTDEAVAAAAAAGYPVALKTLGVLHKSDVGGVALELRDEAALRAAYTAMAQTLGPAVAVQPMAGAGVEISVGFVRDDAFGPLVVVAAGGTLVKLLGDEEPLEPQPPRSVARRGRTVTGRRSPPRSR